jgi:O-antigen/teichoic acid export membrane protein
LLSIALHVANLNGAIPADSVYASKILPVVIAVSSLSVIIVGFRSTGIATAHRNFDQKRIVQITLISQSVGMAGMIVVGIVTRSIWALVTGGLVASLIATVLSHTWMNGTPNRFRWEKTAFRELISYGKWIFVSSAVSVLAAKSDRLLLGVFVDADVLGIFAIAVLIIGSIQDGLLRLCQTVALPTLSEIARNDRSRLREIYYKLRVPGDVSMLFVAGLLFASGQLLVNLLYDQRYAAAGSMLEVLALSLFSIRYAVAYQAYLALAIPSYVAIVNVVRLISLYALIPSLFFIGGTKAAIWGIALHALASLPFVYYFDVRLKINDPRREAIVLVALPLGFLCGSLLNLVRL